MYRAHGLAAPSGYLSGAHLATRLGPDTAGRTGAARAWLASTPTPRSTSIYQSATPILRQRHAAPPCARPVRRSSSDALGNTTSVDTIRLPRARAAPDAGHQREPVRSALRSAGYAGGDGGTGQGRRATASTASMMRRSTPSQRRCWASLYTTTIAPTGESPARRRQQPPPVLCWRGDQDGKTVWGQHRPAPPGSCASGMWPSSPTARCRRPLSTPTAAATRWSEGAGRA